MLKYNEKYKRHEALTNNFLIQLTFVIACAIYTVILMNNSKTIDGMIMAKAFKEKFFIAFALISIVCLFIGLKTGKKGYKTAFCYCAIFSLMNLYLSYYHLFTKDLFGGYFWRIMFGEYKTLLTLIGIGGLACFVYYMIVDNMPSGNNNKSKKQQKKKKK